MIWIFVGLGSTIAHNRHLYHCSINVMVLTCLEQVPLGMQYVGNEGFASLLVEQRLDPLGRLLPSSGQHKNLMQHTFSIGMKCRQLIENLSKKQGAELFQASTAAAMCSQICGATMSV